MMRIPAFLENDSQVYFAALNTSRGFVSFFDEIFSPVKMRRVVILKGGPGSGKSTMLRSFAASARQAGKEVQSFLCSSDPRSLDAVLLPQEGICVLDGTAPHLVDATCPGAVEELFDAGAFWDKAMLRKKKEVFFAMILQKKEAYRRGYKFLKLAGELLKEKCGFACMDLNREKLLRVAARQFETHIKTEVRGEMCHRQTSAFCGSGALRLESFHKAAERIVRITPGDGVGRVYLAQIRALAIEKRVPFFESVDFLFPDLPDALYFPQDRVLFFVGEEDQERREEKVINCARFQSKEVQSLHRNRMRFLEKSAAVLLEKAADSFREASDIHARLESDYIKAMDFEALSAAWEAKKTELLE